MFASLVSDLFNDPTRLKILSVTSKEPKSAREIAHMFSIPLGRCYRKIKKLEEDCLLAVVDRPEEAGTIARLAIAAGAAPSDVHLSQVDAGDSPSVSTSAASRTGVRHRK